MTQGRRGQVVPKLLPGGLWRADVRLGTDPATGKPVRRSVYGRTEQDAIDQVITLQYEHRRGLPVERGRQRLDAYLTDWLEHSIRPRRSPGTTERYTRAVTQHITPYLGAVRLDRLTPEQVERLLTRLATSGRRPRHKNETDHPPGLAPASVLLVRAVLRRALTQAVRRGYLARNPAALVEPPTAAVAEATALTDTEAQQLLKAAQGTALEGLVTIALGLGLRQGEALGLVWEDVDLAAGVVHVRRQLQRVAGQWRLADLKTPASRRDLPLPATVAAALRAHQQTQARRRQLAGAAWKGAPWPLVFPSAVGTPWEPRNLTRAFKALLDTAKLPTTLRWHELRHSAGSLLHARGVDLATIKAILGHSQIALTANRYTHVASATKRAAADAMDAALSPSRPATGGRLAVSPTTEGAEKGVGPAGFEPATSEL